MKSLKNISKSSINISYIQNKETRFFDLSRLDFLSALFLVLITEFSIFVSISEICGLTDLMYIPIFISAIISVIILIFNKNYFKYIFETISFITAITVILALLKVPFFQSGLIGIHNNFADVLAKSSGIFINKFQLSIEKTSQEASIIFMLSVAFLFLATIIVNEILKRRVIFSNILLLAACLINMFFNVDTNKFITVLLCIAFILTLYYAFSVNHKNSSLTSIQKNSSLSICIIATLIISVILSSFTVCFYNFDKFKIIPCFNTIKSSIDNISYNLRYKNNKVDNFTHGDFKKLDSLVLKDGEAFDITMDKPESLYLKGYIGSIYNGKGFEDIPDNELFSDYPTMFWLNQDKFSPVSQLSAVSRLCNVVNNNDKDVNVSIKNINADSRYIYTTYGTSSINNDLINNSLLKPYIKSSGFFGQRNYKYSFDTKLIKNYPNLATEYGKNNDKSSQYSSNEKHYNAFVYKNYTDIDTTTENFLQTKLNVLPYTKGDHVSYETAYNAIMKCLSNDVAYSEEPGKTPSNEDFLQYFLGKNKKGFAPHFATATVMMYRYFGIPSRYVEGYLVTPNDVKTKKNNSTIKITGKNAHAWAEIYQDGIGWVPVETTPPYLNIMEKPDFQGVNYSDEFNDDSSGSSDDDENETGESISNEETSEENTKDNKKSLSGFQIAMIISGSTIGILIIFIIVLLILVYIKKSKRTKSFQLEDNNQAICNLFHYAVELLKFNNAIDNKGKLILKSENTDYQNSFDTVSDIMREAKYSTHKIELEKKSLLESYIEETKNLYFKNINFFKKIWLKFFKGLI